MRGFSHEMIVAYLKEEMPEEEVIEFEAMLARNTAMREEVEKSRGILGLLESAFDEPTIRVVHGMIGQALDAGATDIHMVATPNDVVVYFRIDGQTREAMRLPKEAYPNLVNRWKLMSDAELAERRVPQHGHISVTHNDRDYDLRVTFLLTGTGERVVAHILDRSRHLTLDDLGIDTRLLAELRRLVRRPKGFIPLVGPAAGGRTTLLYALLRDLAEDETSSAQIVTVEDPVESFIERFSSRIAQINVDRRRGLTTASVLRSVARADFDVVVIDDLPDRETAELALQMAGSGRLVIAQITGSGGWDAIGRLRELGVDPFLVAQTLVGVIGRRLVRRLCPECVVEETPSPVALRRLGLSLEEDAPFRRGAGCEACRQTGFQGHVGLLEQWQTDPTAPATADPLRALIANSSSIEELWRHSFGPAHDSLWDDARRAVREGLTSADEAAWALIDYRVPTSEPKGGRGREPAGKIIFRLE